MLDLLINDPDNPRTLAFQSESIRATLTRLAAALEGIPIDSLIAEMAALSEVDLGAVEGDGQGASYARQTLISRLETLSAAARGLSDRLSLRYFSHIDSELHAVAS